MLNKRPAVNEFTLFVTRDKRTKLKAITTINIRIVYAVAHFTAVMTD